MGSIQESFVGIQLGFEGIWKCLKQWWEHLKEWEASKEGLEVAGVVWKHFVGI